MKFLKKIFGLNGRLDRRGYLLFGVLPMVAWIFLVSTFRHQLDNIVSTIIFFLIFILALISTVKRGRDSGLNGLLTLLLFTTVPILVLVLSLQFKINISYMAFVFFAYLLLMPSSSKKVKLMNKVEYIFTLMAIIIVLPFLIFVLAPASPCIDDEAQVSLTCTIMEDNAEVIKIFKLDNGVYPTTEEGLNALVLNPNTLKYPNYPKQPYYKKLPKDVWGLPIIYVKTKDGFELISYGADRKEGGEDEGADILYSECEGKR